MRRRAFNKESRPGGRRTLRGWLTGLSLLVTLVLAAESWGQGLTPLASPERYRSLIAGPRVLRGAAPSPAIAEAFARYQEGRFEGAIEQIDKIIDQMRDQGDRIRQAGHEH